MPNSRDHRLPNGEPCEYAADLGSDRYHEHDHTACLDGIEPPSPPTRCGIHGDDTTWVCCVTCDRIGQALQLILADDASGYEGHAERVFAAAVALVAEYVADYRGDTLAGTLQAIHENLEGALPRFAMPGGAR